MQVLVGFDSGGMITHGVDNSRGQVYYRTTSGRITLQSQVFNFDVRRKRRELLTRLPHLAGQYFSTSDWRDLAFAVVGLAYHASTLLLPSILFLILAGSAFSVLRKS